MKRMIVGLLSTLLLATAGCMPEVPPISDVDLDVPAQFPEQKREKRLPILDWWFRFDSEALNAWMAHAFSGSPDLKVALARMDQAAANHEISTAAGIPSLELVSERRHSRTRSADTESSADGHRLGLAARYEVDLWGRIRADVESGKAGVRATKSDLEAASMTLSAEVATRWVVMEGAREELARVRQQQAEDEALLAIQQTRFAAGQATALDVLSQRDALLATQAILPDLVAVSEKAEYRLLALCGAAPGAFKVTGKNGLPEIRKAGGVAIPAAVLAARPDVKAAGERLLAARWNTEAAKARRLPALTLSASGTLTGASLDLLTRNWILDLAANLTAPLLDGGRRQAMVEREQAVTRERMAQYRKVVMGALEEVAVALSEEKRQAERVGRFDEQLKGARVTAAEARRRYLMGRGNFETVLSSRERVRTLERRGIQSRVALLTARISLIRSVGGRGRLPMEEIHQARLVEDGKDRS